MKYSPKDKKSINAMSSRAQARYDKLIKAASEVFLERGFEEASMSEIVKRAGGSLSTIYEMFGSKEQLFRETLSIGTERFFADIIKGMSFDEGFEEFLYAIGSRVLGAMHDEKIFVFHRLIVHEGFKNNAKLGKIFFECSQMRVANFIAKYFDKQKECGIIDVEDTTLAAHQFVQAVKEPLFFAKLLGLDTNSALFDADKSLRQTIKLFGNGMLKKSK
jgi:TetR/AcrR family transcriptional repressor of cmeABC operon